MSTAPTAAQRRVLGVFARAEHDRRPPPTIREVGEATGIRSTNGVRDHFLAIQRKGLLTQVNERQARAWTLTPAGRKVVGVAIQAAVDAPWDDCKVAFGVKVLRPWFDLLEKPNYKARLPEGWTLAECDGAGARWVLLFRVEGVPMVRDGQAVRALLDELDVERSGA